MTILVTHSTVVVVPDDGTSPVGTDEWNAGHTLSMATGKILGRATAGTGSVEEIATTGTGSVVLATAPTISGPLTMSGTATVTTAGTSLVMEQTGDTFGTSRLTVLNRNGSAGALFENAGLDLVDFGFKTSTAAQTNIRYEHRSGSLIYAANASPPFIAGEYQIGDLVFTTGWMTIGPVVSGVAGRFDVRDTTASTSGITGSLTVAGGAGVALDIFSGGGVVTATVAVASLPAAAAGNKGMRMMVSNATATTFWSIVAGGGANIVPVTSDGTNWRIG